MIEALTEEMNKSLNKCKKPTNKQLEEMDKSMFINKEQSNS